MPFASQNHLFLHFNIVCIFTKGKEEEEEEAQEISEKYIKVIIKKGLATVSDMNTLVDSSR